MWLNITPGKPHRDVPDIISVPMTFAYEGISFEIFLRLYEKDPSKSYAQTPGGVKIDQKILDNTIRDATEWVRHQTIEDRTG